MGVRGGLAALPAGAVYLASAAACCALAARSQAQFVDLDVYRMGGAAVLHGDRLYQLRFGGLPFTYPPFAAVVFTAVAAVPWGIAVAALTGASALALPVALYLALRLPGPGREPARGRAWRLALAVGAAAIWLEPARATLGYGQVDILLAVAVLYDLSLPDTSRHKGVAIGLAAGFKLTPAIFAVYLFLTGRRRAAATATAGFAGTVAAGFAVLPASSAWFWAGRFASPGHVSPVQNPQNQSLFGALARTMHTAHGWPAWLPLAAAVAVAGLALAADASRRGDEALGFSLCAVTGLLVSPISWIHHWVIVIPALLAGGLAASRAYRAGNAMAAGLGAAAITAIAVIGWAKVAGDTPRSGWLALPARPLAYSVTYVLIGLAVLALAAGCRLREPVRRLVSGCGFPAEACGVAEAGKPARSGQNLRTGPDSRGKRGTAYAGSVTMLRIALAQVNATVGDLDGNAGLIVEWTRRAAARGARVVVFPEMMLTGYPVEDLALRASFVEASIATLHAVAARLGAEGLGGIAVVTGYLDRRADLAPRTGLPAGAPLDAAALLHGGRVVITSAKHHLPNYGVFDEFRYFVPGDTLPVFGVPADEGESVDVAIAICEDLWQDGGPVAVCRRSGAGLLVVPNASPYERGKDDVRLDLCVRRAREAGAALAYANMIGGQDELVFDGDSIVVLADGTLVSRGPQFEEALVVADLDLPAAPPEVPGDQPVDAGDGTVITIKRVTLPGPGGTQQTEEAVSGPGPFWPRLSDPAEVYAALVTGVRDYVRKNGFGSVILALSGGIDSALTATIAADAIGPSNVHVVLMPSRYSSEHSVTDAEDLVKRQGLHAMTIPIRSMVDAFTEELSPVGFPETGLPAENLQARVRGVVLMGLSNAGGHLVLTTGNKSELATGYSTLYGDSAGGFGPIKDVPKTLVWELSRWRNAEAARLGATPPIPENSITKPPSAELAPGQMDTDSLPPYEVLDALLDDYVEKDMGTAELIAAGHDPALVERVVRLVDTAEYKRRQYPPGPKISQKNFGRDRRLPITNRWREPRQ